ncbi:hypothetical protein CW714_09240 [Methanophagales archaeon]|nr:MAG: hypothetical protein CW714_09240 [Methanophagales archaeon]
MKELLIASAAFALFILCRRMAGMTKVISDASDANLVKVVVAGKVVALPLIIGMALISSDTGSFRSGVRNEGDKHEGRSRNTYNRFVRAFRC